MLTPTLIALAPLNLDSVYADRHEARVKRWRLAKPESELTNHARRWQDMAMVRARVAAEAHFHVDAIQFAAEARSWNRLLVREIKRLQKVAHV